MPNAVSSIIRSATRLPTDSLNILTFPSHERYESCFALLPHQFYSVRGPSLKEWNSTYAPLPRNYTLLSRQPGPNQIPADVDIDVILSQNKFGQYSLAKQFAKTCHLPLVSLEHTLPHPAWTPYHTLSLTKQRGDINVFLSEYSRKTWGWEGPYEIIEPAIDVDTFTPEWFLPMRPQVLSVVNDWKNRDWACGFNLWVDVTKNLPVLVLGDNPGMSKPAQTTNHLVAAYRQSQVFLNTSLVSTCPFTLLEAMACGCAVVSTATTMIPQIIQDGVNGFCSNQPDVLRRRLEELLADYELCRKLGREARKTVEEKYSFGRMASDWDCVLRKAADIVVTGETT